MVDPVFSDEVEQTIQLYEEKIGQEAGRTRPMIKRLGAVEALSRLMVSPDLQKGFKVLRDSNQLERSFEALVVRFRHLFKAEIVEAAEWRIKTAQQLR